MNKFNSAWAHITSYAKGHATIVTLDRRIVNQIVQTTNTEIVVISQASRNGHERHLKQGDFRFAWDRLVFLKSMTLNDIDPRLRGRRAIVFAFLSRVPGVEYTLNPLTLHMHR